MIERSTAIEIARARAISNGWAFGEPVSIIERRRWLSGEVFRFELETNPSLRGTKARFVIDAITGEVVSEGYIAR